jgi:hypothetical protein
VGRVDCSPAASEVWDDVNWPTLSGRAAGSSLLESGSGAKVLSGFGAAVSVESFRVGSSLDPVT